MIKLVLRGNGIALCKLGLGVYACGKYVGMRWSPVMVRHPIKIYKLLSKNLISQITGEEERMEKLIKQLNKKFGVSEK